MKQLLAKAYRNCIGRVLFTRKNRHDSRVLIYHDIESEERDRFEEQVKFLNDHFQVVSLYDFVRISLEDNNLFIRNGLCAVTFDDGFRGIIDYALPILEKYGIKATVFVNLMLHRLSEEKNEEALEEFCKRAFPRMLRGRRYLAGLRSDDLRALIKAGHDIGCHGVHHADFSALRQEEIDEELAIPLTYFRFHFSHFPKFFAYPYGRKRNISALAREKVTTNGYEASFTGISRRTNLQCILQHEYPRTGSSLIWSLNYFRAAMAGAEDLKDFLTNQY